LPHRGSDAVAQAVTGLPCDLPLGGRLRSRRRRKGTFIEGLLLRHTSKFKGLPRRRLNKEVLGRLTDYIVAHLDEHIKAGALAKIAGRSPFHFTRIFARSVGMTPYRYVVHLRLQRALELMRDPSAWPG
jgi:transcriptional regulator GlxA family with amidase domain